MTATAYLEAEAATQGDKELPPWCHPRRVIPLHIIDELSYAADLFQRAERAIAAELAVLGAAGIDLGQNAALRVQGSLSGLAALAQLKAIEAREAHANGL
ncbi:MAG: hypothetical protein WA191_14445 [Telluria sp.]